MKSWVPALMGLLAWSAYAGPEEFPRTASGKLDFSGRYDISTLTPYTRRGGPDAPAHVDAKAATDAADGARRWYEHSMRDRDPNRAPPEKGANVDAGSYDPVWFDQGLSMFEIDGRIPSSIIVDPPNGQLPPPSEAAIARWRARGEARAGRGRYDDPETLNLQDRCLYLGHVSIPALPVVYNNIKTIVQTEDHVMILIEWMHWARLVRMNTEHLPEDMRSLGGDSIGWWEDDTLVVETTNFFSSPGVPDEGRRVVERFSPLTGDSLLYRFTVHDPNRAAPYTGEMPWPKTDSKMFEYACHEGNYSMFNTLRGARHQEQDDLGS